MSFGLESIHDTASRMSERWGRPPTTTLLDFGGGLSANMIHAEPAEIFAEPSTAHILSLSLDGERHHRQWRDGRLVHDGPMPARSVQIVASGQAPRAVLSEATSILHVYVPSALLREIVIEYGITSDSAAPELIDPCFAPDPTLVALLEQARVAMHALTPLDRLWREGLASAICARMLAAWSNLRERWPTDGIRSSLEHAQADWRVRRAIEYLEAHLADDIGLTEVARVAGLTPTHLTTRFHATVGEPPHRWLMRRRFERACEMLADPRRSVTEVAHACGFASSQHLATVFRKRVGITPSEYRRARQS